jgi:hypothetical protein
MILDFFGIHESPVCRKSPDGRGSVVIMSRYPVSLAEIKRFGDFMTWYSGFKLQASIPQCTSVESL